MSDAHIPKHPSSACGEQSEPHAISNAHIPTSFLAQASPMHFPTHTYQSTLRAQAVSPRIFQQTRTDHPSSAGCDRSEPHACSNTHIPKHPSSAGGERSESHALSNAHIPNILRAQAAERIEHHALTTHTYQAPFAVSICFCSYALDHMVEGRPVAPLPWPLHLLEHSG